VTAALDLRAVGHRYRDTVALDGIDFTVEPGELVALVGPSGSGKSTLLAIAGGLLAPSSGTCLVAGQDLYAMSERDRVRARRDAVGFVFQASNLVASLSVLENVLSPEVLRGVDRRTSHAEATELLAELGMADKAGRMPNELSGGERQRVGIARALIGKPAVVLADEPTANLDGERGRAVVELLRGEVHARGVAAVLVTHDERVLDLVDRVQRIADGALVPS
jgi:putative ABC transport system ATP-binding protein